MMNLATLCVVFCIVLGLGGICYRIQALQLQRLCHQGLVTASDFLELMKLVQQHRGISTAVLGGQENQSQKLHSVAFNIERCLDTLDKQHSLEERKQWQGIKQKWQLLKSRVSSAVVLDNFEHHCDLLQDMHALVQDLTDDYGLTTAQHSKQRLLANKTFRQLPTLIENLGQLRALSTHAAANNSCITAFRLHLQFLIEQLSRQKNVLQQTAGQDDSLGAQISSLLIRVNNDILQTERIDVEPEEMFRLVTVVMETCYGDIETGVRQLNSGQI